MSESTREGSKEELVERLTYELRLMSSYDALFSQAVAERVGMHSTDIETMDLLNTLGILTAGELSERTGLSTGATTRLIDRLERAGYVRRRRDEEDRRRVLIELVWENLGELESLYRPVAEGMTEVLSGFTQDQLRIILEFVSRSNAKVAQVNAQLRAEG